MNYLLKKFIDDPWGFLKLSCYKLFIAPFKYGFRGDYDASRYWHDRFKKHGATLKAVGDEGLSLEDNELMYAQASETFRRLLRQWNLPVARIRVLEVGAGTGFYTNILHQLGVQDYNGVDITDAFFPELRSKFPTYRFHKQDITQGIVPGEYDLIVMIDVLQHIVNDGKLAQAMKNLAGALAGNGRLVISPVVIDGQKHLFNVRFWSPGDIKKHFPRHTFSELIPFRKSNLLVIQNKV